MESAAQPEPGPVLKEITDSWAPPAAASRPAGPASGEAPDYAVLVADEASLRPADIARVLAAARKVPLLDMMRQMRHAWGIIEEGVAKAGAEETAKVLEAGGVKALAVPAALLEDLPPAGPATNLIFSGGGLTYAEREAPARHADWRRLALVAAAGVNETTTSAAAPGQVPDVGAKILKAGFSLMTGMPTSLGMGPKPVERKTETTDQVYVVDLVLKDPAERVRIEARRFDFSCLGARKGYNLLANVKVLVGVLAQAAPRAALGRGSRIMLDGRPLREMGYDGLGDLERESRWRLTLAALTPPGHTKA